MKFISLKILLIYLMSFFFSFISMAQGYHVASSKTEIETTCKSFPETLPKIKVSYKNHPSPGHYFITSTTGADKKYSMIIDTSGTFLYFRRTDKRVMDFRLHDNGYLYGYESDTDEFVKYDSSYNKIGTLNAGSGYETDFHDLLIEDDGSYWMISNVYKFVNMSLIVPGGNPNATVVEGVIQHLSADGNVLFQWNSLDHIPVTDTDTGFIDLTATFIDYIHINALDLDTDGNLLISSRHLNEITKIDIGTGEIIWRLGGNQNEFFFINDNIGFSGQHSIRSHGDGFYTLFDNGNRHNVLLSRGIRYYINEDNRSVELIDEYTLEDVPIYSSSMGHLQWIEGVGAVAGWSNNAYRYILTEYDENGNKKLDLVCEDEDLISYRAFKFPWRTNKFFFLKDLINITWSAGTSTIFFTVPLYNNDSEQLIINDYHFVSEAFSLNHDLPITIPPYDSVNLSLEFSPSLGSSYSDVLTVYSINDDSTVGIACQTRIKAKLTTFSEENTGSKLKVSPNPVSDILVVTLPNGSKIHNIEFMNLNGKIIQSKTYSPSSLIQIPVVDIDEGLYLLKVTSETGIFVEKLIVN